MTKIQFFDGSFLNHLELETGFRFPCFTHTKFPKNFRIPLWKFILTVLHSYLLHPELNQTSESQLGIPAPSCTAFLSWCSICPWKRQNRNELWKQPVVLRFAPVFPAVPSQRVGPDGVEMLPPWHPMFIQVFRYFLWIKILWQLPKILIWRHWIWLHLKIRGTSIYMFHTQTFQNCPPIKWKIHSKNLCNIL